VSGRRDPRADHLITPENAALLVIDYQPSQVAAVRSMDHQLLLKNVVSTVKTAKAFGLPIVHSWRCIPPSMRSVARLAKRIAPDWNVSRLPEDNP
jgi:nicotinamidase-related amidase